MRIDQKGKDLLAEVEGCILHPYLCPAKVPTIGLGNTFYENGVKVKMTDKPITKERAYQLFDMIAPQFENAINKYVKTPLTQNEFNALFIFAYNVGISAFEKSTLLKVLNTSRNPLDIKKAWLMWKGKNDLLLNRRNKEIHLFFS